MFDQALDMQAPDYFEQLDFRDPVPLLSIEKKMHLGNFLAANYLCRSEGAAVPAVDFHPRSYTT